MSAATDEVVAADCSAADGSVLDWRPHPRAMTQRVEFAVLKMTIDGGGEHTPDVALEWEMLVCALHDRRGCWAFVNIPV